MHPVRIPGFSKWRARIPGGPELEGQNTWKIKSEVQKRLPWPHVCKKWTRLPGGPDYLVAATSEPDHLGVVNLGVAETWFFFFLLPVLAPHGHARLAPMELYLALMVALTTNPYFSTAPGTFTFS